MKEPIENTILVCSDCIDEVQKNFRKSKVLPEVGNYAKLHFYQDKQTENMWVLIKEIKNKTYIGVLHNDPLRINNIKYNDKVEFKYKDIIELLKL